MTHARLLLLVVALTATTAHSQVLFSYEDLDPDATSPVGNGLTITDLFFDAGRPNVGQVDVGAGTSPFMSLLTSPAQIDVSSYVGKAFSGFAETLIPASSTINTGDSVYLQIDYFNDAIGAAGAGNFVRSTNGFYTEAAARDTWLPLALDGIVPAMTDNGNPVDRAAVSVVIADGGFAGGTPNDSGPGAFALIDNFSYTISELPPPNPLFYQNDAPSSATMGLSGVLFEPAVDPLDASNDVGEVIFGGVAKFSNVNIGPQVQVSAFEGQKFRASFDYLIPADTALEPGEDVFFLQLGFNDPISASLPQGGGNTVSAGFADIGTLNDGQWRTLEITGTIPPDSTGASMLVVFRDDLPGADPDTFGSGMFIDNVRFEAIEVLEGDYNNDGLVDAADYTLWRDNLGAAPPAEPYVRGDAINLTGERSINFAGDGMNGVTQDDYLVWANGYGAAPASAGVAVPEPASGLLLLVGFASASLRRAGVARRFEAE
ncbi:hypothetical protein [Botrimarina hoheduenensis]|uniref:PEP-CTERM protein-sorting domain-containing protein n=1 Tax=Botrimarina hoheduenensis TaxID=2528000 RepID=A0A5C5VPW9_9BACT|nr:hypothetical protein [Botrimarina hoheduenensis]TWT40688.1 hypothetical protein Pla111_33330 [Botrimarina hoheduenensis]